MGSGHNNAPKPGLAPHTHHESDVSDFQKSATNLLEPRLIRTRTWYLFYVQVHAFFFHNAGLILHTLLYIGV